MTSSSSVPQPSQSYGDAVQEASKSLSSLYQQIVDDKNQMTHDRTEINNDKEKINETVIETLYDKDGKAYQVHVHKYSPTEIAQLHDDIAAKAQDIDDLIAAIDQLQADLEKTVSSLASSFIPKQGSQSSTSANATAINLNRIMQHLRQVVKEMEQQIFPSTSRASKDDEAVTSHQVKGQASLAPPNQAVVADKSEVKTAPTRELALAVQQTLFPVLQALVSKSPDFSAILETSKKAISNNTQLKPEEKQLLSLSLFILSLGVTKVDSHPKSAPLTTEAQPAPEQNVAAILGQIWEEAEENIQTAPLPIQEEVPSSVADSQPAPAPAAESTVAAQPIAETDSAIDSLPAGIPDHVVAIIEKAVESTAFVVVSQVQGATVLPTVPVKEQPLFQAAHQAIRATVKQAVEIAVQTTAVPTAGSTVKERASAAPVNIINVASLAAKQAASALIVVGKTQISNTIVQPAQSTLSVSIPGPVSDGQTNGADHTDSSRGSIQQFLSGLDTMIGSGTYSQLAVESALGALVRSAGSLQQLLSGAQPGVTANASSSGVDAIQQVGDGQNRGSINSISPEVVKEKGPSVSTQGAEDEETLEAPDVYHQILAV